jgi:GrpB-like predicted nucleotidyltransferase (UPF0157 family)
MKLGLKKDEIKLEEYTPEWGEEFTRVKKDILNNLNIEGYRIQHIGSTAIKGILAKPIIDILMGVDELDSVDEGFTSGLKASGFLRLKVNRPGEIIFARFTDDTYTVKTHFIHVTEYKSDLWNNLIFFRDYLNTNETARKEYLEMKMDYLKKSSSGINEYTIHKEAFVKSIFNLRKN